MTPHKPSICFVALQSYGVLSGDPGVRHIGGAEVQQVLIARELQRRGYDVRFVVHDYGQPDGIDCAGIPAYKKCPPGAGIPIVRFCHPNTTSLWSAISRAGADVVYQRGAGSETGQVAAWCRLHGKPFIFGCANDTDCARALPDLKRRREKTLYRYGLRRAAAIVAQTTYQQKRYRSDFDRETDLIRSCTAEPPAEQQGRPERFAGRRVLWVGRLSVQKRPEMLLDIAGRCPDVHFDVVGAANIQSELAADITRRAESMANVTLHGEVPYERMGSFYAAAAALLCTSRWEGYPNVFLEAWARGVPTLSTLDPDSLIANNELGLLGDDADVLAGAVKDILDNDARWTRYTDRVRRYYLDNHTVTRSVDAYERLLERVFGAARAVSCPTVG